MRMLFFESLITLLFLLLLGFTIEAQEQYYINHTCWKTTTSANSEYQSNLSNLLNFLSKNATRGVPFYNTTYGRNSDMVYGLYLCRGDVSNIECAVCVSTATNEVNRRCPVQGIAVIWYDSCLVHYSNQSIFSIPTVIPQFYGCNMENVSDREPFNKILSDTMNVLANLALNSTFGIKYFATRKVNVSRFQTLYSLVQCTPDLSSADCNTCLQRVVAALSVVCNGKEGGRRLNPSCNVRYEVYPFYIQDAPSPSPTVAPGKSRNSVRIIIATVVAISVSVLFFFVGCCLLKMRARKQYEASEGENRNTHEIQLIELEGRVGNDYSNENFHGESTVRSNEFPFIPLNILQVATEQFCAENKLGEGGFGLVYKGKLVNGKEIAVKRLSRTSGQGLLEFKNEVMLIARLQHRNLVKLLGCCLEQNEKLLIYEYMPNKSLDVFLFDSSISVGLDWQRRLSIINGIARGIQYLHEDSRLRIIHRDLKASNILLDHEMNPKISDFGMARIFGGNQSEANTNRVVGTYGYMSPEYAMEGLFSIKSDVFSFGVLLLEIISGKRNNGFHLSKRGESLLTFAWKLWSKGQGLELIDPRIDQSCVPIEVLKCIHIGLLCVQEDPTDRPTMSSVVVMLGSETITLSQPAEPAFSIGRVVVEPTQSSFNDGICSINEVTISNVSAR